jgi:hypothetical protein
MQPSGFNIINKRCSIDLFASASAICRTCWQIMRALNETEKERKT